MSCPLTFDMHVHTKYSHDGRLEPEEIIRICEKKKIDGIAITDHDTIRGGIEAKKIRRDVRVIVGAEILTDHGELIGYHLNEEIRSRKIDEVIDEIKGQGGWVAVPHPFERIRKTSVDEEKLAEIVSRVDFIECLNGRAFWFFNERARKFASRTGKKATAGSDAHMGFEVGMCRTLINDAEKMDICGIGRPPFPLYPLYPLIRTKIYKTFGV